MTSHCNQDFIFLGQLFLFFGWETEETDSNLPQIVQEACGQRWRENPDLLHADLLSFSPMATLSLHPPSPCDSQWLFFKLKLQFFTINQRLPCLLALLWHRWSWTLLDHCFLSPSLSPCQWELSSWSDCLILVEANEECAPCGFPNAFAVLSWIPGHPGFQTPSCSNIFRLSAPLRFWQ